jgi:nicotinamidase-related amidase
VEDICDPTRLALVVYDMQIGIVKQIENGQQITDKVLQALDAARKAGIRVFFTRHMSLPKELMGVSQFRMAMAWQRVKSPTEVKPWFLRDAPEFHLIPEMNPRPSEAIFDKITMSAFEGTPLNIALRDCGVDAFAIFGIAMEIGIEPTYGTALILVTSLWLLKTPAVSVIAMRQSVHLRASNSQAMLCLQTSKRSAPSFGAYNRNSRWSECDRMCAPAMATCQWSVALLPRALSVGSRRRRDVSHAVLSLGLGH